MATVSITAHKATGGGRDTVPMLTVAGTERATQSITSSGSNQVSTVIGNAGETVTICSSGGAVKVAVAVAANPNATSVYHYIVGEGGAFPFYCGSNDTRFAVVDV